MQAWAVGNTNPEASKISRQASWEMHPKATETYRPHNRTDNMNAEHLEQEDVGSFPTLSTFSNLDCSHPLGVLGRLLLLLAAAMATSVTPNIVCRRDLGLRGVALE
mmetsp:Transcript_108811/g.325476  ORF Transcript_108811/g.325476 Transcript_108811/m.325476 type:complete len:106 (-) Transcript_108811:933-1250(-)